MLRLRNNNYPCFRLGAYAAQPLLSHYKKKKRLKALLLNHCMRSSKGRNGAVVIFMQCYAEKVKSVALSTVVGKKGQYSIVSIYSGLIVATLALDFFHFFHNYYLSCNSLLA